MWKLHYVRGRPFLNVNMYRRTNKGSQKVKAYLSFVGYTNSFQWEESSLRGPWGDTEAQGSQVPTPAATADRGVPTLCQQVFLPGVCTFSEWCRDEVYGTGSGAGMGSDSRFTVGTLSARPVAVP